MGDQAEKSGPGAHRGSVKMRGLATAQEKRREAALARQKAARRDLTLHARSLAGGYEQNQEDHQIAPLSAISIPQPATMGVDGVEHHCTEGEKNVSTMDIAMSADGSENVKEPTRLSPSRAGMEHSRTFYATQLASPEWMVDVPADLRANWYVLCHPEGERCLVVAARGGTVTRRRNGSVLHKFPSLLPNGSRATMASNDQFCILDAVFHPDDQTYYVLDIMCWKGQAIYDCGYEFRAFWVACKMQECDAAQPPSPSHRYRLVPLPAYECTPEGLQAAYQSPVPYIRGGLTFYNKEGHYTLGPTPLIMVWKDAQCSRYFIDTDKDGVVLPQQRAVLRYTADGSLVTGDDPPVVMANLPASFVQMQADKLRPGLLIRCVIGNQGMHIVDGRPVAAEVHWDGLANQRRGGADSFTKVLFQYAARHQPLTIQHILEVVQASGASTVSPM
mmetsp:Transcript_37205/g.71346  ORF Transcript_37205/g.71346 Transcript_37205/m.71346 type:complete len:446 (+) Transcript_37205:164-1501(+)